MQRNDYDKSTSKTTARYGALFGGTVTGGVAAGLVGLLGPIERSRPHVVITASLRRCVARSGITCGLVGAGLGYLFGKRLGLFAISRTRNEINQFKSSEADKPSLNKK